MASFTRIRNAFSQISTLHLLCLVLIGILWLTRLGMIGMFSDGLFYGCISRNLIFDPQATMWDLKVSNGVDNSFNGHPPMAFWLQALWFKVFGDVYWIERAYSLCCAFLTMLLIRACWRIFSPNSSSAVAVLCWLAVPMVGWSYTNNMLENTVSVFTLAAVWLMLRTQHTATVWQVLAAALAAILTWLATMTKGPVALFPLATGVCYALVYAPKKLLKALLQAIFMATVLAGCYWLMFKTIPRGQVFFERYFDLQLVGSFAHQGTFASHLHLLGVALEENLVAIILAALSGFALWRSTGKWHFERKTAFLWLLIGASASLPMLISVKQMRWYIVPAEVYFALGFATMIQPAAHRLRVWATNRTNLLLATHAVLALVFVGILGISIRNTGGFERNQDSLHDLFIIEKIIPHHAYIHAHPDLLTDWTLHGYLYRYFYVDLDSNWQSRMFALSPKDKPIAAPAFQEMPLNLRSYRLYKHVP